MQDAGRITRSTVTRRSARPRRLLATGAAVGIAAVVAACTPAPSEPAPPGPPVVSNLRFVAQRTEAPVVGVLRFNVSDPNNDELTCRLDTDGDGTTDETIVPCRNSSSVLLQVDEASTRTVTIEVSDGEFPAVTDTTEIVVSPAPAEDYEITLRLAPGMDPAHQQAFEDAADRWAEVITAGVPDVPLDLPGGLLEWNPPFAGTVDDVLIDARSTDIDGPGGVLGSAGAILIRDGHWQPYYGIMQFDEADLADLAASGRLGDVILHEMGHVIGIGGSWTLTGRLVDPLVDPGYNGTAGMAAWAALGGSGYVPVEADGGAGTALSHWRESVFADELMTGYLGTSPALLSNLTIASLADQGYGVDLGAADTYSLPGSALRSAAPEHDHDHEHLHTDLIPPMLDGLP